MPNSPFRPPQFAVPAPNIARLVRPAAVVAHEPARVTRATPKMPGGDGPATQVPSTSPTDLPIPQFHPDLRTALTPVRGGAVLPKVNPVTPDSCSLCDVSAGLAAMAVGLADLKDTIILAGLNSASAPTGLGTVLDGSRINTVDKYVEAYRNRLGRLIRVRVYANFTVGGQILKLSKTNDGSDQNLVDALFSAGKLVSDWIYLAPEEPLWANTGATAFDLTGAVFSINVFDPKAL